MSAPHCKFKNRAPNSTSVALSGNFSIVVYSTLIGVFGGVGGGGIGAEIVAACCGAPIACLDSANLLLCYFSLVRIGRRHRCVCGGPFLYHGIC